MELDYTQIGKRLKEVRGKLTQAAFGEQLGYGYGYVKNCEHGKKPSLEYLHKITKHYNLSMDWLLYGEDPISSSDAMQKVEAIFDPDLKRMIDVLKELMESDNQNLRGWAIIQFENAFKEHCAAVDEKKLHA
jgi:transcriptional regulator with XRE-family HTH domain